MIHRKEIDGLRAVAVLPVMLFHAGNPLFQGGFVGVDVFFVISGYLITSIIFIEKQNNSFNLLKFYERRARRILPALLLVMLVSLPISYLLMLPDDFENFGQSLFSTTFFANNILLWLTSGYFSIEGEFKPLIHTWSLAVEEQFYILYPVLILMFWKLGIKNLAFILSVLGLLSLFLADWASRLYPEAAFYLLPTRGWELLIGALGAVFLANEKAQHINNMKAPTIKSEILGFVGFILIIVAVFTFNKNTPFPGIYALVPTLGAFLIIVFVNHNTFIGRILSNNLLVGLGLISYSAYLWHQPLFAFTRLYNLEEPKSIIFLILIVVSLLLASLTWKYVEQPFRDSRHIGKNVLLITFIGLSSITAGSGYLIYQNSGFVHLWPELNSDTQSAGRRLNAIYNEKPYLFLNRAFKDVDKDNVLIWGNSFARDFINAGVENGYFSKHEISYSNTHIPICIDSELDIDEKLRLLILQAKYFVLAAPIDPKCWEKNLLIFRKISAANIIVLGTKNFGWNMNSIMRLSVPERYYYKAKVLDSVMKENDEMINSISTEYFVNIIGMISDSKGFVPVFTDEKKIISQDTRHLTKDGAKFIGQIIFRHSLLVSLK